MFSKMFIKSPGKDAAQTGRLRAALDAADVVVIGAGAGLSASAGFVYTGARQGQRILFLELGVGYNTPGIIKYPFWRMTAENPEATYACINVGEAACPEEIAERSICIDGDIGEVLKVLPDKSYV